MDLARGVVVYLAKQPDGRVRLTMDDVSQHEAQGWKHDRLFTHVDLPLVDVREGSLPRNVLEQIADNLMIRLAVLSPSEVA